MSCAGEERTCPDRSGRGPRGRSGPARAASGADGAPAGAGRRRRSACSPPAAGRLPRGVPQRHLASGEHVVIELCPGLELPGGRAAIDSGSSWLTATQSPDGEPHSSPPSTPPGTWADEAPKSDRERNLVIAHEDDQADHHAPDDVGKPTPSGARVERRRGVPAAPCQRSSEVRGRSGRSHRGDGNGGYGGGGDRIVDRSEGRASEPAWQSTCTTRGSSPTVPIATGSSSCATTPSSRASRPIPP